jgi:ketosteroid isomerase-like protein
MDSMAGPVEPGLDRADSPNLQVVKETFEVLGEGGLEAAIEHLLKHSHDDAEFAPYLADGVVLRGPDEVRAFYRGQIEAGTVMTARPTSIEERGDEIVVNGSLRVVRATGGFAESQLTWTYRFRDGLLQEARGGPRRAA